MIVHVQDTVRLSVSLTVSQTKAQWMRKLTRPRNASGIPPDPNKAYSTSSPISSHDRHSCATSITLAVRRPRCPDTCLVSSSSAATEKSTADLRLGRLPYRHILKLCIFRADPDSLHALHVCGLHDWVGVIHQRQLLVRYEAGRIERQKVIHVGRREVKARRVGVGRSVNQWRAGKEVGYRLVGSGGIGLSWIEWRCGGRLTVA